jgi:hypothetical protein
MLTLSVGPRTTELPRARAIVRETLRRHGHSEQHLMDVSIVLTELLQTAAEESDAAEDLEVRLVAIESGTRIEIEDHLTPVVALGGVNHALRADVLAALTRSQGSYTTASGGSVIWADVPISRGPAVSAE